MQPQRQHVSTSSPSQYLRWRPSFLSINHLTRHLLTHHRIISSFIATHICLSVELLVLNSEMPAAADLIEGPVHEPKAAGNFKP